MASHSRADSHLQTDRRMDRCRPGGALGNATNAAFTIPLPLQAMAYSACLLLVRLLATMVDPTARSAAALDADGYPTAAYSLIPSRLKHCQPRRPDWHLESRSVICR